MEKTKDFQSFINFIKNSNYYIDPNKLSLFSEHKKHIEKLLKMGAIEKCYTFSCDCGKDGIGGYFDKEEINVFYQDIEEINKKFIEFEKERGRKGYKANVALEKIQDLKIDFLKTYFSSSCDYCEFITTGSINKDYAYFTNPKTLQVKYTKNLECGCWNE